MNTSNHVSQWGGAAFMLGSLLFLVNKLNEMSRLFLSRWMPDVIVLAIAHGGFISWLADVVPPSLLPYAESFFLLVIVGLLLLISGLIWFGILNLRQPVLARWQWLPLVTGLMGFIGFFLFSGEQITAVFLLFRTLFALGLLGLGLTMWLENSPQGIQEKQPA